MKMQYVKHLHEDLKSELLYLTLYTEDVCMAKLNIPGYFDHFCLLGGECKTSLRLGESGLFCLEKRFEVTSLWPSSA